MTAMIAAYRFEPSHIAAGGLVAGAWWMAFEMLAAAMAEGMAGFLGPLHAIGVLIVGNDPTRLNSRDLVAFVIGVIAVAVLSATAALIFGGATARVLRPAVLMALGMLYGGLLWMGVLSLTPPGRTGPLDHATAGVHLIAFVLFYGLPLARYLARHEHTAIAVDPDEQSANGVERRRRV